MKRRIALYTSSFPPQTGGTASAHFNIHGRLARRHDVMVFTYRDRERRPSPNVIHGTPLPGTATVFPIALRRLLGKGCFDRRLRQCDIIAETAAHVVSTNWALRRFSPDIILCSDNCLPALLLRKPPGSRLVWMARHNYRRFAEQPLVPPANSDDLQLAHRLERRAVRKADAVISPSEYMLSVFRRCFEQAPPMRVARNFVDDELIRRVVPSPLRTLLGLPERALVVSIPSGGAPIKGLRYLCEIARGLAVASPIGVYVSGYVSDDIRWELEQLAPRVRCFLPGHVGYDVNLAHVAACDLTVSPTLIENLSNALVESILLGVPVVTFDTGGNSEIIEAGRTGVIVGHADVEGLIREVRCLITSPAALQALRSACAPNARRLIDPSAIERVFEDVFDLIHPPVRGGA